MSTLPPTLTAFANELAGALWADRLGGLVVAGLIVAVFLLSEAARRLARLPTEYTRKGVHVGGGAVVLAVPWLLDHTVTLAVLCLAFFGLLVAGKVSGQLQSVHGVQRRTSGAYYYPLAVIGTWWLSEGDPVLFCTPIAIMALADTGAALMGKRPGNRRYRVLDGHRSFEGSLPFFGLALCIVLGVLSAAGVPGLPATLLVPLLVAVACTASEAISWRGSDNLLIPYAAFLVLDRTLRLGLRDLSGWIEGMILGLALVSLTWRRGGLTEAAGIAVFLVATLAWALGGWTWFGPMAALYLGLVILGAGEALGQLDLEEVIPTCLGGVVVVLAFGHSAESGLYAPYLASLGASGAIALGRLAHARRWPRLPAIAAGIALPVLPALLVADSLPLVHVGAASLAGLLVFTLLARTSLVGRRFVAALTAGALTWALV